MKKRLVFGILGILVLSASLMGCGGYELTGTMQVFEMGFFRVGASGWSTEELPMTASSYLSTVKIRVQDGRYEVTLLIPSQELTVFQPLHGVKCWHPTSEQTVCMGRQSIEERDLANRIRYVACLHESNLRGFEIWRLHPERRDGRPKKMAQLGRSCGFTPRR